MLNFHDAAASFVPPPDARWRQLMPTGAAEIIVHGDLAPWNLVAGPRWTYGLASALLLLASATAYVLFRVARMAPLAAT